MSEQAPAPSEQPAPETTPAQTPGEQPAVTDHSATIQTLDKDQLEDVLFGEKKEPAATKEDPKPTEQPAPEAKETPAPAEEPAPTAPEAGAQPPEAKPAGDDDKSLRRLPMGNIPMSERKQMAEVARMIRDGEATSQIDALQKMGALPQAPPAGEQPTTEAPGAKTDPEPPPAAEEPPKSTTIQESIDALREQRKQAQDDFDGAEADRLTREIENKILELADAKADERIAAAAAESTRQGQERSYRDAYLEAVDSAEEKFPWMTDESDPRYQILEDKVLAARSRGDEVLEDPSFILDFAGQVNGYGQPQQVTPPPPPPAPAPKVVGASVAPGHTHAQRVTETEARSLMQEATKDQLAAALGWGG